MPGPHHRRLFLERLEDRALLAGNVTVSMTGGVLTIAGDAEANSVVLSFDYASQTTYISGKSLSGAATLINGQDTALAGDAEFTGVVNVQVSLADGNDRFEIGTPTRTYTKIARRLDIEMGAGDDTVILGKAGNPAGGADPVVSRVVVGHGSWIDLGAGNDDLVLANLKTVNSLVIQARDGNDDVTFATEFTPTGATDPQLFPVWSKGNLHVHLGAGEDTLTGKHVQVNQNFLVRDTGGETAINLYNLRVGRWIDIGTSNDADVVAIDFFFSRDFKLQTGGGADDVDLAHGSIRRTNVNLGEGDDDLRLRFTRSSQSTQLDGGGGGADFNPSNNDLRGLKWRQMT